MKRLSLLSVLLATPLTMCQTDQTLVSDYCSVAAPIKASKSDTNETLRQVLRENAKFRDFCATPAR